MKNFLRYKLAAFFLIAFFVSAFGQTNAKIEQELVAAINEVQKYSAYGGNYDDAKVSAANEVFREKLLNYTKTAATLKYAFPALGKLLTIATADDGKLRIYSWDLETGGTMHSFSRVYQYLGADGKVYSKPESEAEEGDAGSFAHSIYTQPTKNGAIYAVCSTAILSNPDHYQAVSLYKIEGAELKDKVELFKTAEGLTDSIGFEYDFFSIVERQERPVKLILFDKATKTIKIPVVIQDKKNPLGRVTNRFINYRFDGNYFVKVK